MYYLCRRITKVHKLLWDKQVENRGSFPAWAGVTVRALRHYEEIYLLTPEIVDRDTGYRYYSVGQLQKTFSITKLKSMDYSLEEIRDLWDDDHHFPTVESLEEKIHKCEDELAVLKERKRATATPSSMAGTSRRTSTSSTERR